MLTNSNSVLIAAHRGNSRFFPENTICAFESALKLPIDQLEIDLHLTRDEHLILMHDHLVDRTTDGHGLIREKTLKEMLALDAGIWKGEQFRGTRVPTFEEFIDLMRDYPDMTVNVELKDYPDGEDAAWARKSCDMALKMLEDAHMSDRIWINCWSGEMLEYVDREYGHRYKLHGYFPFNLMHGRWSRDPYEYLHCVCLFGTKEQPVVDKSEFDRAISRGVQPWCYFSNDSLESYDAAIANGCRLLTCNDPKRALEHLHSRGLHQL